MAWRLLIVEDDANLRQMLAWDLEERGYRVVAVGDCKDAISAVKRQGFDLGLIDYHLPDGDGLVLLERLLEQAPEMAGFLCTGLPSDDLVGSALQKGARALLVKPVTADRLDARFRAALCAES